MVSFFMHLEHIHLDNALAGSMSRGGMRKTKPYLSQQKRNFSQQGFPVYFFCLFSPLSPPAAALGEGRGMGLGRGPEPFRFLLLYGVVWSGSPERGKNNRQNRYTGKPCFPRTRY